MIRFLLSFLFFVFPVVAFDVTVCGTGVVGLSTAYMISTELEKAGLGDKVILHVVGKWDWQAAQRAATEQEIVAFDHETSGWGPFGLQLRADPPWNDEDGLLDRSHYFVSPDLNDEEEKVVDLFNHWHSNHLNSESERFKNFLDFNNFCNQRWHVLEAQHPENPFDLFLQGCWAFRSEEGAKELIEQMPGTLGCFDSKLLSNILPFWAEQIDENQFSGVFIPEDGMVDSLKLRTWMWGKLLEKRGGKPTVVLHQGQAIERLLVADEGICQGVQFEDGSVLKADLLVLATGYGTKALVKDLNIELPLGKLWGAVLKAELKTETHNAFPGPMGTGPSYRLLTAVQDGKRIVASGPFSFIVPEGSTPAPLLFKEPLKERLVSLFKEKIDPNSIRYILAPRVFTPDELPVVDLEQTVPHLMVLLPTYHLGLTQSLGIGHLVAQHILQKLGKEAEMPFSLSPFKVDRFSGS